MKLLNELRSAAEAGRQAQALPIQSSTTKRQALSVSVEADTLLALIAVAEAAWRYGESSVADEDTMRAKLWDALDALSALDRERT